MKNIQKKITFNLSYGLDDMEKQIMSYLTRRGTFSSSSSEFLEQIINLRHRVHQVVEGVPWEIKIGIG